MRARIAEERSSAQDAPGLLLDVPQKSHAEQTLVAIVGSEMHDSAQQTPILEAGTRGGLEASRS